MVAHPPGRRARLPLAVAALLAAASAGALVQPAQAAQTPPPPQDRGCNEGSINSWARSAARPASSPY